MTRCNLDAFSRCVRSEPVGAQIFQPMLASFGATSGGTTENPQYVLLADELRIKDRSDTACKRPPAALRLSHFVMGAIRPAFSLRQSPPYEGGEPPKAAGGRSHVMSIHFDVDSP